MADAHPENNKTFKIDILNTEIKPKLKELSELLPGMTLVGSIGIMLQADKYIQDNKVKPEKEKEIKKLEDLVKEYIGFGDYDFDVVVSFLSLEDHKKKLIELIGLKKKKKNKYMPIEDLNIDSLNPEILSKGIKLKNEYKEKEKRIEMDYIGSFGNNDNPNKRSHNESEKNHNESEKNHNQSKNTKLPITINGEEIYVEEISKLIIDEDKADDMIIGEDESPEEIESRKEKIQKKIDIKMEIMKILKESMPNTGQNGRNMRRRIDSGLGSGSANVAKTLTFFGGGSSKKKTSKKSKRSNKRKSKKPRKLSNKRKSKKPRKLTNRKNKKTKRRM